MKAHPVELTVEQIGTIRLALMGWSVRCDREAATMDEWAAEDFQGMADKCRANAAASRRLKADAEAVLAALQ